jgi:hypothetical protein
MVAVFPRVQQGKKRFVVITAASLAISGGAKPKPVQTMLDTSPLRRPGHLRRPLRR